MGTTRTATTVSKEVEFQGMGVEGRGEFMSMKI
jgi:hypothetical protein